MDGSAGMLPERQTAIDSSDPAIANLTAQMFAEPIATGEVVVDDPPAPAPVVVNRPDPQVVEAVAEAQADRLLAATVEPLATPESVPTFKPKLDDELQALLDEPDFDEEARVEVAAEVETDEYQYDDPEATAKQRAAEKRIAFLEGQLVAKSKKGWVEEAKRAFPDLARLIPGEIEGTQATSRRKFMQAVAAANTKYATILGPTIERLEADRAAIASGAVAVAREEVANAWGKPAGDILPAAAQAQTEALQKARDANDLTGQVKALMQTHQVL